MGVLISQLPGLIESNVPRSADKRDYLRGGQVDFAMGAACRLYTHRRLQVCQRWAGEKGWIIHDNS